MVLGDSIETSSYCWVTHIFVQNFKDNKGKQTNKQKHHTLPKKDYTKLKASIWQKKREKKASEFWIW